MNIIFEDLFCNVSAGDAKECILFQFRFHLKQEPGFSTGGTAIYRNKWLKINVFQTKSQIGVHVYFETASSCQVFQFHFAKDILVFFFSGMLVYTTCKALHNRKIVFLVLNQNICCWYSKEPFQ